MRLFSVLGLFLFFALPSVAETLSTPRVMIIELSDLIRQNEQRASGKIPYRAAKMIEVLLYRAEWIEDAYLKNINYDVKMGRQSVHYLASEKRLSYKNHSYELAVKLNDQTLEFSTSDHEGVPANIALNTLTTESLQKLEEDIYDQTLSSRGYQTQYLTPKSPSVEEAQTQKEFTMNVQEKWAKDGSFEGSKWALFPVRLISWPAQKILYEIPGMVTSTVMESVTRSPGDNLRGAGAEFYGAGKLAVNGLKDMFRGIIHPKRATFFDGAFEVMDVGFKLAHGALGIAKSAVSVVAYPVHRLFGGAKSHHVPLRGKRAVIILIDSMTVGAVDTYGEMIVRSKVKSFADYYCVYTPADGEDNDMHECIDKMPPSIQYLDIISLQHSGGGQEAEDLAKYAAHKKGVRPELLLSIGCYDSPSKFGEGENALGQMGTSWAVHYYLANMLEKRLRGEPADRAASEAFQEGFATNAVDPISLGAVLVVGLMMESDLKQGYFGSQPHVLNPDLILREVIKGQDALIQAHAKYSSSEVDDQIKKVKAFYEKVEVLLKEKKIDLRRKTKKLLRKAEIEIASITL